jgi:hypothetical protein
MIDLYRVCASITKPGGFVVVTESTRRHGVMRNLAGEMVALCQQAGLDREVRGRHEAIVPEDLFGRMQEIRGWRTRVVKAGRPSKDYLLRKLLYCEAEALLDDFARYWEIEDAPAERHKLLGQLFDRIWQDAGRIVAVKPRTPFARYFQAADTAGCDERERRGSNPHLTPRIEIRVSPDAAA